jgi:type III restriction enzyme
MDAIECGIVKLPRVPVADNIAQDVPRYRELWKNIKSKMPKKGRGKGGSKDPESHFTVAARSSGTAHQPE